MRARRRAAERVDHDQHLDQVLIDGRAGRLHQEHVGAADVLVDLERHLGIGKSPQPRLPHRHAEELGDLPGEPRMGAAGEHLEISEARLWHRQYAHAARHRVARWALRFGWGGRIRTFEYGLQRPAPYRLATPQYSAARQAAAGSPRRRPAPKAGTSGAAHPEQPKPQVYTSAFNRRQARGGASAPPLDRASVRGVHRPHAPAGQRRLRAGGDPGVEEHSEHRRAAARHRGVIGAERRQVRTSRPMADGGG